MSETEETLKQLGFPKAWSVAARISIVDLFPKRRTGLYALQFANGEAYLGKSVDVTRRFLQHKADHGDLIALWFQPLVERRLDEEERRAIWSLEKSGVRLRNIEHVHLPRVESDLDALVPRHEQDRWVESPFDQSLFGSRTNDPEVRRRFERRVPRLLQLPRAKEAVTLLRTYACRCLLDPIRTELSFWSVSCLPGTRMEGKRTYARVNINWQEVFSIEEADGALWSSWHMARTPLEQSFGPSLRRLLARFPGLEQSEHRYDAGGHDQVHLYTWEPGLAEALLADETVARAIRLYNLQLMRKGPGTYGRYHCFALADRMLLPAAAGTGPEAPGEREMSAPLQSVEETAAEPLPLEERHPVAGSETSAGKVRVRASTPDRTRESAVEEALERLVPEERARRAAVSFLAKSVALADQAHPGRWGVSLLPRAIRLNVGMIEVFSIRPDELVVIVDKETLPRGLLEARAIQEGGSDWQTSVSGIEALWVLPEYAPSVLPTLEACHATLIRRAAETRLHPSTKKGHSPNVVEYLSRQCELPLAQPLYNRPAD